MNEDTCTPGSTTTIGSTANSSIPGVRCPLLLPILGAVRAVTTCLELLMSIHLDD
jgi:hypothetical protein